MNIPVTFGILFCVQSIFVVTGEATEDSQQTGSAFRPPCSVKRMEISFPHVSDVRKKYVKSHIPGRSDPAADRPITGHLPDAFFLEFSWRKQKQHLVLYRTDVATPAAFTEWEDDNVTFAETINDKCYYHGYVRGHRSSYTAVSTCHGVAGYVQTDEEFLFIEPAADPQSGSGLQAHLIYTCEDREPATERHQWAPPDYSDAQMDAHWRRKRAARRRPKHLEVFMAVAPSTVKVVGKSRVKDYVMTLMNIVNSVYQHSSLGVDIRVSVVRLELLNDRTSSRMVVTRNAYATVRNFCEWAMYLYKPSDPQTHDIAVFLTREDLGPADYGIRGANLLGYAPITGLCNPIRSCAAIKDEGFTSAFIIAHEMAHVFGLFHDGHGNRCHGREYRTAIMATLVESKLNHYWWSICSKERMQSVIDYLYCLNDDPYQLAGLPDVPEPLGKSWSLNEQCILEFGQQFSVCRAFYADSCNMLWCGTYHHPHLCRTKRGPPLPGTQCGRDKQCLNGRCEYVGNQTPVHGQWGYWTSWTPCSSECGIGIRHRGRKCDNPSPKYGGQECKGGKDEMGTCVNKKCSRYTDVREGECEVWTDMNIRAGRHTWKPYPAIRKEDWCKQTCISDSSSEVVTIDVDTEDGTPCTYDDDSGICITGKCRQVGCDGIMNSTKSPDNCGVCGGDNSFCKTVRGEFLRMPASADEYEQVVFLPHGAKFVEITKTKTSPHFIAMKDPERGTYYMNGEGRQEKSKKLIAEGSLFTYARGQTSESLVSRGPLKKNLEIMLFPAGHLAPASIAYSYTVNKDDHTLEKTKYKWKFSEWSGCSVTCGTGVQTIIHRCFDKQEDKQINDEMCSFLDKPRQDQATCHRGSCDDIIYIWAMENDFTNCSASCGSSGYKMQKYRCERNYPNATYEFVEHSFCESVAPPNETVPCNRIPCDDKPQPDKPQPDKPQPEYSHQWSLFEEFTDCSESCGYNGVQLQRYECERTFPDLSYEFVDHHHCDDTQAPDNEVPCNRYACEENHIVEKYSHMWALTNEYSDCSESCGDFGVQRQKYVCERNYPDDSYEYVDPHYCRNNAPPNETIPCNRFQCVEEEYSHYWILVDEFTECTATCGKTGVQQQLYECERSYTDDTYEYVDIDFCEDEDPPTLTVPCNRDPCLKNWTVGEWGECSKTCGMGVQSRDVYCGDPDNWTEDDVCVDDIPSAEKICNDGPCIPKEKETCSKDKYSFCKYSSVKKCKFEGFRKMCCKSCGKGSGAAYRRWTRMVRQKRRLRIKRRLKAKRRENLILRNN